MVYREKVCLDLYHITIDIASDGKAKQITGYAVSDSDCLLPLADYSGVIGYVKHLLPRKEDEKDITKIVIEKDPRPVFIEHLTLERLVEQLKK